MSVYEKFEETNLPKIENFFSTLTNSHIDQQYICTENMGFVQLSKHERLS